MSKSVWFCGGKNRKNNSHDKIFYIHLINHPKIRIGVGFLECFRHFRFHFRIPLYLASENFAIRFFQIVNFLLLFGAPEVSVCPYLIGSVKSAISAFRMPLS